MSEGQIAILDTHQHLIDRKRFHYSWADTIPQLKGKQFGYEEYIADAAGTGIRQTVFMESSPDEWDQETRAIYDLADEPGSIIKGVIAGCRLEQADATKHLDSIADVRLAGVRRICHVEKDEFSEQPQFVQNVRGLGKRGLTFDLCFLARQLGHAEELARSCPNVQFILDHCGVPNIAGGDFATWQESIRKIAGVHNVACKISGLTAYCSPENAGINAVRPYIRHVIDCFGPHRLVWGSDWPLVTINSTLVDWVRITRQVISDLSIGEQQQILCDNAVRIYLKGRD